MKQSQIIEIINMCNGRHRGDSVYYLPWKEGEVRFYFYESGEFTVSIKGENFSVGFDCSEKTTMMQVDGKEIRIIIGSHIIWLDRPVA